MTGIHSAAMVPARVDTLTLATALPLLVAFAVGEVSAAATSGSSCKPLLLTGFVWPSLFLAVAAVASVVSMFTTTRTQGWKSSTPPPTTPPTWSVPTDWGGYPR